jgi:hypothetical protein
MPSKVAEHLKILGLETDANDGDIRNPSVVRRRPLKNQNSGRSDTALARWMLAEGYDAGLNTQAPSARALADEPADFPRLCPGKMRV